MHPAVEEAEDSEHGQGGEVHPGPEDGEGEQQGEDGREVPGGGVRHHHHRRGQGPPPRDVQHGGQVRAEEDHEGAEPLQAGEGEGDGRAQGERPFRVHQRRGLLQILRPGHQGGRHGEDRLRAEQDRQVDEARRGKRRLSYQREE